MTEFTPERLAELKAVAEAATHGSRAAKGSLITTAGGSTLGQAWGINWRHDLRFMAEVSPETVLSLIAALEAANESRPSNSLTSGSANERELAELRAALEAKTAENVQIRAENESLRAEISAKTYEAERLRAMGQGLIKQRDEARAKEALHAMPDNRLGTLSSYITTLEQERDEARADVERVRELHRKRRAYADDWDTCTCGYDEYPCPTIQEIERTRTS